MILIVAACPAWSDDQPLAPDVLVRKVLADVLAAIRNTSPGDRESRERALAFARQDIVPHIDFERMTRLAVGRAWRTADARQREALVANFSTLITRVYASAIDAYDGHEVQIDPLELTLGDKDVIVRSRFRKAGAQPVEVDYAMWKSVNGWKVYDIIVENVSLVITYRSQFGEEIVRDGIDGLIRSLEEKNRPPSPRPSPARGEGVLRHDGIKQVAAVIFLESNHPPRATQMRSSRLTLLPLP